MSRGPYFQNKRTTRRNAGRFLLYEANIHPGGLEFGTHPDRNGAIGDDTIQFTDIRHMRITSFIELGRIKDSDYLIRLLDHDLIQQRLLQTGGRNAILQRERIDTQEEFVTAEITQHIEG